GSWVAGRTPGSARRIVQFRAPKKVAGHESAATICSEHLAVGKQCGRVTKPRGAEAARRTPGSAGRIVQFRGRMKTVAVSAACGEHLAVGKQCGRVTTPRGSEAAGHTPGSAGRIVQFRARENAVAVATACDAHLAA